MDMGDVKSLFPIPIIKKKPAIQGVNLIVWNHLIIYTLSNIYCTKKIIVTNKEIIPPATSRHCKKQLSLLCKCYIRPSCGTMSKTER